MNDWPFDTDADRDHPLAAHRIAVTSSHPSWRYLVAFDRESEAQPTEAETAMLVSFLDEYKTRWYNSRFLGELATRPLDVDGGANGVVFHKWADDDWGYRRQSYTMGYLWSVIPPGLREEYDDGAKGPFSLSALMDRIQGHNDEGWSAWKAAHPGAFPVSA